MNPKITPKNVWSLDTIDIFTATSTPLQSAANILSTCSQIYSVRCDDISNKTAKLLDTFQVATKKKKKTVTGDTNRDFLSCEWSDPFFSKILKGKLDCVMNDGYLQLFGRGSELCESTFDGGEFQVRNKVLCPDFGNMNCENIEYEGIDDCVDDSPIDFDINPDVNYEPVNEPLIKKGWAGPNYWRVTHKKIKSTECARKKKERTLIDFKQTVDRNSLLITGNNNLCLADIRERKRNYYFLPNDYLISVEDVYRYLLIDASFRIGKVNEVPRPFVPQFEELPEAYGLNEEMQSVMPEPLLAPEIIPDTGNTRFTEAARNLFKKCAKIQKRVDIKKIKDMMYKNIETEHDTNLIDVYSKISGNKDDNVSLHYCIVSLLHLANEKNVKIVKNENNISVKR